VFFDRDLIVAGSAATAAAADTTSLRRYTLSSGFLLLLF
jgi:hypothetical protein